MSTRQAKIQQVLEQYPTLTNYGFGIPKDEKQALSKEQQEALLKAKQDELFQNVYEIEYVVNWLADVQKTKSMNQRHSSYGLKHIIEKTAPKGYIANGSFIVGAIIAGFDVKITGVNAYFNISEKSLKEKTKGIQGIGV